MTAADNPHVILDHMASQTAGCSYWREASTEWLKQRRKQWSMVQTNTGELAQLNRRDRRMMKQRAAKAEYAAYRDVAAEILVLLDAEIATR